MVFVGEVFEDDPCLSLHTGVLSEAHQSPNRQHLYKKKYQVLHCINTVCRQVKILRKVKMFLLALITTTISRRVFSKKLHVNKILYWYLLFITITKCIR